MIHSTILPLVDLHIHLGGSMPVGAVWDILVSEGHQLRLDDLTRMMTYSGDNGPYDFDRFFSKFDILNLIKWTEQKIYNIIDATVKQLRYQGIKYAEIRFTIDKYLPHLKMSEGELVCFVGRNLSFAGVRHGIQIVPVLSIKYESDRTQQKKIIDLIDDNNVNGSVFGIDLVGDERFYSADFYIPIFSQWKSAGKGLMAHVGESQPAENVRTAIEKLGVNRISHGIAAACDSDILKLAVQHNVSFDMALTSNLKTGIIKDLKFHPVVTMLGVGCDVTLGTDDPVVFDTTLMDELRIAEDVVGLNENVIYKIQQTAIDRAIVRPNFCS